MAQTSVEWLKLKIKQIDFFVETKQITWKEYYKTKDNLYEQAKEMHKEQMIDATVQYLIKHCGIYSEQSILQAVKFSEEYYNKTFKNETTI
jgi:hypothetical protein